MSKESELLKINKTQVDRINKEQLRATKAENDLKTLVTYAYYCGVTDGYAGLDRLKAYISQRWGLSCEFNNESFQDALQKANLMLDGFIIPAGKG